MNKTPFFSIIIPAYNVEDYISSCLYSILSQSFSDYELIIINDGSTDSTASILLNYQKKNPDIKIITQSNSGPGRSRNAGVNAATGKYVWFIDSDDTIPQDSFLHLHDELTSDGIELDVLMFTYEIPEHINNLGEVVAFKGKLGMPETLKTGIYERDEALKNIINTAIHPNSTNKIFSRALLNTNNILFTSASYAEDLLYNVHAVSFAQKIKIIRRDFYTYLMRSSSLTHTARPSHIYSLFNILLETKKHLIALNLFENLETEFNIQYWHQADRVFDLYVDKKSLDAIKLFLSELDQSRSTFDKEKESSSKLFLSDLHWIILLNKIMDNELIINHQMGYSVLNNFHIPSSILQHIICDFMNSKTAKEIYEHFDKRFLQIEDRISQRETVNEQAEERIQKVEQAIAIITSIFEDAQEQQTGEN